MTPWLGILTVLFALTTLVACLSPLRRRWPQHPEVPRKLLHLGMGCVCLCFPWIFQEPWPVWVLAGLSALGLLGIRMIKPLQAQFGQVIGGVERKSFGELYFPIGVAVVFTLAADQPVLFLIPILVLSVADASASLIGIYYSRFDLDTGQGRKTTEGSITFFTTSFLATHVPLLLMTDAGRGQSLLIGLILALLLTMLEAVAWRGLDNLFVPIGAYLLLVNFLSLEESALLIRLGATVGLTFFAMMWRSRSSLDDAALLGAAFFGFIAWAVAGWAWLLPPLAMFVWHGLSWPRQQTVGVRGHSIYTVLSVIGPSALWLTISQTTDQPKLLVAYAVAFATRGAFVILTWTPRPRATRPHAKSLCRAIFLSWFVVVLPTLLLVGPRLGVSDVMDVGTADWGPWLITTFAALISIGMAATGYWLILAKLVPDPIEARHRVDVAGTLGGLIASGLVCVAFLI